MVEWIVSSSVLIAAVMVLRFILKGKISLRLQYALWALVLIRLLVPVSFGGTPLSVENVTQKAADTDGARFVSELVQTELPRMSYSAAYEEVAREYAERGIQIDEMPYGEFSETVDHEIMNKMNGGPSVADIAGVVWLSGVCVMGLWFLATNLRLAARLKQDRKPLDIKTHTLRVYVSDVIDTPCLFGLFRPAVYVTREAAEHENVLRHAVEHELTHFRHRDNLWAILRGVCLALHWYNPLVWCAAVLSRNDGELACDESTILRLGESERAEYGRTLISLTCRKRPALLNTATTMTGSGKSIKERIALIVKKPKMAGYTLIAVILIAALAVGCTFTGAEPGETPPGETDAPTEQVEPTLLDDAYERALPLLESIENRTAENTISKDSAQETVHGDETMCDVQFPVSGMDCYIVVTYTRETVEDDWTFAGAEALAWALPPDDGADGGAYLQQTVNSILVGALSYDETWQSHGDYTLTVTGSDGRTDAYTRSPGIFYSLDSTPGHWVTDMYDWAVSDEPKGGEYEKNEYTLQLANDRYTVTVYSHENRLKVEEKGQTVYLTGTPRYGEEAYEYSMLFLHFRQEAMLARESYELSACSVSGAEADHGAIARELAEQYAEIILDRPGWYHQQAQDAKVGSAEVFDAYYGAADPNFCFAMTLYLKMDEAQTMYWQAGAGLTDPPADGEFAGYYGYSGEVSVRKGEDGRWRMDGIASGGVWAYLPIALEEATTRQLVELYFLTSGHSHDFRIPYALAEWKPLEEVHAQLDLLDPLRRRELTDGILAFMESYPEYHTWSPEDF